MKIVISNAAGSELEKTLDLSKSWPRTRLSARPRLFPTARFRAAVGTERWQEAEEVPGARGR